MWLISIWGVALWAGQASFAVEQEGAAALRMRLTAEPATLDWTLARSSHETPIIMNIMEGLVEENQDLQVQPALAEKWEQSSDGKVYTFTLRDGVKWSDGRALKAQDFVDAWLRLLDAKTQASYWHFLADIQGAENFHSGKGKSTAVGIKALTDRQLQVTLRRAVPHFLHLLSFWVCFPIRLDVIQKYGNQWTEPGHIATLGPYLLFERKKGHSILLNRNTNYYGVAPSVPSIRAWIEPDDKRARELFDRGEIDFLSEVTTQDLMKTRPKSRVEKFPYLATYYLGFNARRSPLNDASFRRALGLAIDREAIPAKLQGGQVSARGFVPPGVEGHNSSIALEGSLYDARAALAKKGFAEGKGFPRLTFLVEKFDGAEVLAEFLETSFREKLGIEVTATVSPPSEFQSLIKKGKVDGFVGHWGADFADASGFFEVFLSKSGTNYTGWANPAYDKLMLEAGATQDRVNRLSLYTQAEQILLQADAAIVPLFYRRNTVIISDRLEKFEISPLNYLFFKRLKLK